MCKIINWYYVYWEEVELVKFIIWDKGNYWIIDCIIVVFNDCWDVYEAFFINLGFCKVVILDDWV